MPSVLVNGIQLAYHDQGSGEPLLLVHAFPLSSAMWQPQQDELSKRYRVITPDLRGFGQSELGEIPTSLDHYADDLLVLLDKLQIDQVTLAGLSMGGYIAFALLRKQPNRFKALILADTKATQDSEEGKQKREENARIALEQGQDAIADRMIPNLLAKDTPDSLKDGVRQIIRGNAREAVAAALRSMAVRPDSTALLRTIAIPTLIIVGEQDMLTTPDDARAMGEHISQSRLVTIPNVAHLSNLEAPEAFNQAIDDWLSTNKQL